MTATTVMGAGFGTDLANAVNGVGLSSSSLAASHDESLPFNAWASAAGVLAGTITFDLGSLYNLSGLSFWNLNDGGPGPLGTSGIRGVQLSASTDGLSFAPVAGGPAEFAQVSGFVNLPPQVVAFTPVAARYVRFTVLGDWGDPSGTGFAEVAFNGTRIASVPEPSSILLCGLGSTLVLATLSRRATAGQGDRGSHPGTMGRPDR